MAPSLTEDWLAQPFTELVSQVNAWLESAAGAVGHSFGAWLLLCSAVERERRDAGFPKLCLLAPILGKGFSPESGIGYFAPRATSVRTALGLERGHPRRGLQERLRFVHAEQDPQTRIEDVRRLHSHGHPVTVLPGGHRLDHPKARADLAGILRDFAAS